MPKQDKIILKINKNLKIKNKWDQTKLKDN